MQSKLFSIIMITFVILMSACASSGDKRQADSSYGSEKSGRDWQQNQQSTINQKKQTGSYWKEDGLY